MRVSVLSSLFVCVSAIAAPTISVVINGTAGSGIGNTTILATSQDFDVNAFAWSGIYTVAPPSLPSEVTFFLRRSLGDQASLQFSAVGGGDEWGFLNTPLTIGFYERAGRIPPSVAAHPGMDITINTPNGIAYGPNALSGRFVVLAADFSNPHVNRFAAKFEFTDDAHPLGSISGMVRYNFDPTNTITLSSTSAQAPTVVTADITLAAPAPEGGAFVELSTNDPDTITLPASVFIPAGEQHVTVPIDVQMTAMTHDVDILSVYDSAADVATLTVSSPVQRRTAITVQGDPASMFPGTFKSNADARYWTSTYYGHERLKIEYLDPTWVWDFTFDAGANQRLTPGVVIPVIYPLSQPPSAFALPQLFVGRRPTNSVVGSGDLGVGWFKLDEITIDDSYDPPRVISFSAKFDVVLSNGHVRGEVSYNEPPPPKHRAVKE